MSLRTPLVAIPTCFREVNERVMYTAVVRYPHAVVDATGCLPMLIPSIGDKLDIDALLDTIDGLLLTGSPSNVEPYHYKGPPSREGTLHDPDRDATTLPLIREAVRRDIPVEFSVNSIVSEPLIRLGGLNDGHPHSIAAMLETRDHDVAGKADRVAQQEPGRGRAQPNLVHALELGDPEIQTLESVGEHQQFVRRIVLEAHLAGPLDPDMAAGRPAIRHRLAERRGHRADALEIGSNWLNSAEILRAERSRGRRGGGDRCFRGGEQQNRGGRRAAELPEPVHWVPACVVAAVSAAMRQPDMACDLRRFNGANRLYPGKTPVGKTPVSAAAAAMPATKRTSQTAMRQNRAAADRQNEAPSRRWRRSTARLPTKERIAGDKGNVRPALPRGIAETREFVPGVGDKPQPRDARQIDADFGQRGTDDRAGLALVAQRFATPHIFSREIGQRRQPAANRRPTRQSR